MAELQAGYGSSLRLVLGEAGLARERELLAAVTAAALVVGGSSHGGGGGKEEHAAAAAAAAALLANDLASGALLHEAAARLRACTPPRLGEGRKPAARWAAVIAKACAAAGTPSPLQASLGCRGAQGAGRGAGSR